MRQGWGWGVAAALWALGFGAAYAQSIPRPEGEFVTNNWLLGVLILLLFACVGIIWGFYRQRIADLQLSIVELKGDVEKLKLRITDHHIDRNTTKDLVDTTVRIAISEHLPRVMAPMLEAMTSTMNNTLQAVVSALRKDHHHG